VAPPRRLAVVGEDIIDPSGTPIVLRGYNWGQWGTEQPEDGADNLAQGANSVRLPLRWWGDWKPGVDSRLTGAPGHIDPDHLKALDDHIALAASKHLWVVLFLDSNFGQGAPGETDNFWTDPTMKQEFTEVWQFLVARYQATPYIAAYEILAEPKPPGVSDEGVKELYDSIIPVLRAIDHRTPIVVGPNLDYNLHHLDAAYTTVDANIIYTGNLLKYDPSKIPDITAFTAAHHAPVWIDQIGIENTSRQSLGQAGDLIGQLAAIHAGWAWWTYREQRPDDAGYGIYHQDPADDTKWLVKQDWFDLMTRSFQAP
jgi:cellulase (glycosyl hydrolase family 5)